MSWRAFVPKYVQFQVSLHENDDTHLIYNPLILFFGFLQCYWQDSSERFSSEFMVSITSLKSSSTQFDVHLVNYGPF